MDLQEVVYEMTIYFLVASTRIIILNRKFPQKICFAQKSLT